MNPVNPVNLESAHTNVFDLEVLLDAVFRPLAADAGFLHPAERRDLGRVWRVAEALEYGMVGINSGAISTELAPFGGVKESGIGREGSRHGAEEFVEIKYMLMSGLDR